MALLFNGQLIEYGIGSARGCEGLREKWICSFIAGSRADSRGTHEKRRMSEVSKNSTHGTIAK